MLLLVRFDCGADIIDVPQFIIDNVEDYQREFTAWLSDKNIDHAYWHYENGVKYGVSFRSDALVEWLNKFPLADNSDKAKSVVVGIGKYDKALPSIFF